VLKKITLDFQECDAIAAFCADYRDLLVETLNDLGQPDEEAEIMASELIEKFNTLMVRVGPFKVTKI